MSRCCKATLFLGAFTLFLAVLLSSPSTARAKPVHHQQKHHPWLVRPKLYAFLHLVVEMDFKPRTPGKDEWWTPDGAFYKNAGFCPFSMVRRQDHFLEAVCKTATPGCTQMTDEFFVDDKEHSGGKREVSLGAGCIYSPVPDITLDSTIV